MFRSEVLTYVCFDFVWKLLAFLTASLRKTKFLQVTLWYLFRQCNIKNVENEFLKKNLEKIKWKRILKKLTWKRILESVDLKIDVKNCKSILQKNLANIFIHFSKYSNALFFFTQTFLFILISISYAFWKNLFDMHFEKKY